MMRPPVWTADCTWPSPSPATLASNFFLAFFSSPLNIERNSLLAMLYVLITESSLLTDWLTDLCVCRCVRCVRCGGVRGKHDWNRRWRNNEQTSVLCCTLLHCSFRLPTTVNRQLLPTPLPPLPRLCRFSFNADSAIALTLVLLLRYNFLNIDGRFVCRTGLLIRRKFHPCNGAFAASTVF